MPCLELGVGVGLELELGLGLGLGPAPVEVDQQQLQYAVLPRTPDVLRAGRGLGLRVVLSRILALALVALT